MLNEVQIKEIEDRAKARWAVTDDDPSDGYCNHWTDIEEAQKAVEALVVHIRETFPELERLRTFLEVATEFILATPSCGHVWRKRRDDILDEASALGVWRRPDVKRAALGEGA